MRRLLSVFLMLVLLSGCASTPAGTSEPTTVPATVPTTAPAPTEELSDTLLLSSSPLTYRYYSADQTEDGVAVLILYDWGYDMLIFQAINDNPADDL